MATLEQSAQQLLDTVERDPAQVIVLASELEARAVAGGDLRASAICLRALGIARRLSGETERSLTDFDAAVDAARRSGDTALVHETNVSRAATLVSMGRLDDAADDVAAAVAHLDGVPQAFARFQLQSIEARRGRPTDPLPELDDCVATFRAGGAAKYEAHARANRALCLAYAGRSQEAERDLVAALRIYEELGLEVNAAYVSHNLGFVAAIQDDLVTALERYRDSQHRLRSLGRPVAILQIDEATTLAALGLTAQAHELASAAARELIEQGNDADGAEADLVAAAAALAAGRHGVAVERAGDAHRSFDAQSRTTWADAAAVLEVRAQLGTGAASTTLVDGARALRQRLEREAVVHVAPQARLAEAGALLATDRPEEAIVLLEDMRIGDLPAALRLEQLTLLARAQQATARTVAFRTTVAEGLAHHRRYRRAFGAIEVQLGIGRQLDELRRVALQAAVVDGDAPRAVELTLATRATAVASFGLRAEPVSAALHEQLHQLRLLDLEARRRPGDASSTTARRRELEEAIAGAELTSRGGPGHDDVLSFAEIRERAGTDCLLVYAEIDDRLVVARVEAERPAVLADIGPADELRATVEALTLAVGRLSRPGGSARARQATRAFVDQQLDVLAVQLGIERTEGGDQLLVSAPAWLASAPWGLLARQCERSVTLTPTYRARPSEPPGDGVVLVAGPGLEMAQRELDLVQDVWTPAAVALRSDDATVAATRSALHHCRVLHVAAHCVPNERNPLYASLSLADGPLYLYELIRTSAVPSIAVLGSCSSAQLVGTRWDEAIGFTTGLLGAGTEVVISSPVPVTDDASTNAFMAALHAGLRDGDRPAQALTAARACRPDDLSVGSFVPSALL